MKPIQDIFPQLSQPRTVVITTHQKPDADAMGSSLAMKHFLTSFGHKVTVISPTNWAAFLNWMPACDQVLDYERDTVAADALIREADWVYCLDFNVLSRTKRMEPVLAETTATRILIDHHEQPQTEKFAFGISLTSKSSTAEMVYDYITAAGYNNKINVAVAECLYAGVMTDTGSFRFPYTSASVHRLIADLKDKGLDHTAIHQALFDNFSENRLRFTAAQAIDRRTKSLCNLGESFRPVRKR
mgnify:CR=1 FL=1